MFAPVTPVTPISPTTAVPKVKRTVSYNENVPILTITPATLPLTPPLTPRDHSSPTSKPPLPHQPSPISSSPVAISDVDAAHSLHEPLRRHLALLHPATPPQIRHFIATRLLSHDRPYGHEGKWEPIWYGTGDIATAGVGYDAVKGLEQKGEGRRRDERLEQMYAVARRSWGLLAEISP